MIIVYFRKTGKNLLGEMFLMKYDRNRVESLIKVLATVIEPATNQDMFVIAPNDNPKCDCNRTKH